MRQTFIVHAVVTTSVIVVVVVINVFVFVIVVYFVTVVRLTVTIVAAANCCLRLLPTKALFLWLLLCILLQ